MKDLITEARELCERATPGLWQVKLHSEDYGQGYGEITNFVDMGGTLLKIGVADTAEKYTEYSTFSTFIARSRTLISELCDALEKAQAEVERLREHLDNRCDSCACEIANERDKALARLEAEVRTSLHEAQERDKGCDHCNLIYKMDGASYGTTDEIIDNKFCPMCGKRLEVGHG